MFREDEKNIIGKAFECSREMEEHLIPRICEVLDIDSIEKYRALHIVGGNYSHRSQFISLLSSIAENSHYLEYVSNSVLKTWIRRFSGCYKVLRLEINKNDSLRDMICDQIDKHFEAWHVDYRIRDDKRPDFICNMMCAFEDVFPDKGFLLVIEDLFAHFQDNVNKPHLSQDFQVLRTLSSLYNGQFRLLIGDAPCLDTKLEFRSLLRMYNRVIDHDFMAIYLQDSSTFANFVPLNEG